MPFYITETMVRKVLNEEKAFRLAREVFQAIAVRRTVMPPKIYLDVPAGSGDFRAMPAFIGKGKGTRDACGVKWVSVFPKNHFWKKPTVYGTILLNSPKTGELLAIVEGNTITAMRTAAAAALASRCLANPKPKILAIVGAGLQAEHQLRAHAAQFEFREIHVWGYERQEAEKFCARFIKRFPRVKPFREIRSCVEQADIIVTCTPSRKPLVRKDWVKAGAHINAIGADAKGKEELDPKILEGAKVVVDEWEQARHSGEINVPLSKGLFSKRSVHAELAEVVSSRKKGRGSLSEITVFDSTGLAVMDIHFAAYVKDHCHL